MLGHFDGFEGRGGQDHRSVRMIEQPLPLALAVKNAENFTDLLRRIKRPLLPAHNPKNNWTVDAQQYQSFFKFSIVRNPWARAFSWYENVKRDEIHQRNLKVRPETLFDEFLEAHVGTGMLRKQTYWLRNFRGDIGLDFVGRFETLHEDLLQIAKTLGLKNYQLPHEIKGSNSDYRSAYSDVSRSLVAKTYAEEIAMFGYTFENG